MRLCSVARMREATTSGIVTAKIAFRSHVMAMLLFAVGGVCQAVEVPTLVLEAERERVEVVRKISVSTVAVFGTDDSAGGGSAVVISPDGFALTNFHVTKPVGTHLKCGMNDGVMYDAVIVGVDPTGDVALIKLLGREDFPAAELGDSDLVQAGDWCIVSGNPFLLATDFQPTVTYGIVSGVHRYQYPSGTLLEYADCIQTDASINPGNSGGPLWNARGQLIGINGRGSFEKRGRVNVGVGYAISINQIKKFMGYLHSGRIVDHATLGATVATTDDSRVLVTNILDSSDAYRRGLRYGDELISFAGRIIASTNDFKNMLGTLPKGWRVPLTYARNGQQVSILVRLEGVHRSEELLAKLQLGGIAPPPPNRPDPDEEDTPGEERPERQGLPGQGDDSDEEGPRTPRPQLPMMGKRKSKELDPKIAKLFTERRGYANYYFNQLKQDQIWEKLDKPVEAGNRQAWQIQGMIGMRPYNLVVTDRAVGGRVQGVFEEVDFDRNLGEQRSPKDSGGLLLALHVWRRLFVEGPKQFGEVYYLGTGPLYVPNASEPMQCDILVATYDALESRFYFDPTTGKMMALEMFPDIDVDPCELHFGETRELEGRTLPAKIDVVFGDKAYGTLTMDSLALLDSAGGDQ